MVFVPDEDPAWIATIVGHFDPVIINYYLANYKTSRHSNSVINIKCTGVKEKATMV